MTQNKKLEILFSQAKLRDILKLSVFFIVLGFILFNVPTQYYHDPLLSRLAQVIGIITIVFFVLCGMICLGKIFDNKPGLILDENGIVDNSSGFSVGFIPWSDIVGMNAWSLPIDKFPIPRVTRPAIAGVDVRSFQNSKTLIIHVKNPNDYIARQSNFIKRNCMRINSKIAGSPIAIATTCLKLDFEEVEKMINMKWDEYKNSKQESTEA